MWDFELYYLISKYTGKFQISLFNVWFNTIDVIKITRIESFLIECNLLCAKKTKTCCNLVNISHAFEKKVYSAVECSVLLSRSSISLTVLFKLLFFLDSYWFTLYLFNWEKANEISSYNCVFVYSSTIL